MLFSRTAVQGIYALCYLNTAKCEGPLSSPAVAEALGIPRDQAAKVLQCLNNTGLVQSVRGRNGGYVLLKRLNAILVVDVLDALNPPEDDERLRPKTCKRDSTRMCSAHHGLQGINQRVRQALGGETLAALDGTVCSDLGILGGEPRAELVCATEGEYGP